MKKIILLLVALLSLSMDSLAQEFTEIQKKLRSDIMLKNPCLSLIKQRATYSIQKRR